MSAVNYVKPTRVWLRDDPQLDEKWVQQKIADDPTLLGLGDLVLRDRERPQPHAGRLDLLLQDPESHKRYEVELQLGKTDETHIIRTIEYWDIERKRYPQYEHAAVIVAESITSRYLNVISLFNGFIPLIALQLTVVRIGQSVSLLFTKVLDEIQLGLVDEDEELQQTADRAYWEKRGSKQTVALTDDLMTIVKELDPQLEPKYNKFYIGLARDGQPDNFVVFRPQKEWVRVEPRLDRSDETQLKLENAGLDVMDYDGRWGRYRIRVTKSALSKNRELLRDLFADARGQES
jgi:hypothetical protein